MVPYSTQDISEDDINAVVSVLKSNFLTQGPVVEKFESAVCNVVNSEFAIATNSATAALHLAYLALGIQNGDNVWTSPITFVATANAVLYCGASIDFVDIDFDTGNISTYELKKKLEVAHENGTLPKAVVCVSFAGNPAENETILKLSKQYGFYVIEDASHSLGSIYDGIRTGSCTHADVTIFSFHAVKIITSAEGGIATCNNPEVAQKMKMLRSHGIERDNRNFQNSETPKWYYEQQMLGFNYRMSEIHAALGLSQLTNLSTGIEKRNVLANRYLKELKDLPIQFLKITNGVSICAYHLFVILLKDRLQRDDFYQFMRSNDVGVQLHYQPVHMQPYYGKLGFYRGQFPKAEEFSNRAISIPLFPNLTIQQQNNVMELIKIFLSEQIDG
jgi:UDP-4-amino-4,6-dideoxy-N-acetyl-beta-L-altrosamine transaminase